MTSRLAMLLAVIALIGSAGIYAAESTDEVISMAQKGVGEEVLLAAVENSKAAFNLSTADIIKMKEAKVPDRVVAAMIRHRPGAKAEAAQPKVEVPAAAAPKAAAAANGILNLENLDDKVWSYMYEPDTQTIWISRGTSNGRGNLEPHGGLSLRMPAGTYNVRYNGRNDGATVTVHADDKSLIMLTRVETAQLEALYVTVFERGERKSGGRLVTLRENPPAKKSSFIENDNDNEPEERVATRERVVEVPSTTVVYRDAPSVIYSGYYPSYYGGYYSGYYPRYYGGYYGSYCTPRYYGNYCSPRYYGGYYSPRYYGNSYCSPRYGGSFGFGYRSGYRSGFSIGIGGRF